MKNRYISSIFFASLLSFGLASCSSEDQPAQVGEETAQVSFAIVMPEGIQSKAQTDNPLGETPWKDYTQCMSQFDEDGKPIPSDPNFPIVANMNITRTGTGTGPAILDVKVNIVKRADGSYVTDPVTVDAGKTYTINTLTITDATALSTVYFSGVDAGANFAPYVSQTLPQSFTAAAFTKPIVDVWVLCARGIEPEKFGKPKFHINRVEVSCIPIFIDVCDKYGEDFVAEGSISLQKLDKATEPAISEFTGDKVTDNLASGSISYLCFADNLDKADSTEWFLLTVVYKDPNGTGNLTLQEVVSLEALKKYEASPSWNSTYNFLDILICGQTFCIFRCDTGCNGAFFEGFEDVDNTADLIAKGWSGFKGDEAIVPGGIPSSGKYMLAAGTDNKGNDTYAWTTGEFKYTTGEKIYMDLNAKIKQDKWHLICDPAHKGTVTVKISLIKKGTTTPVEFGTVSFDVNKGSAGTWMQSQTNAASTQQFETGCYQMLIEPTLPGYKDNCGYHWYDIFNFGIDNIKNAN
ncbi:MAG: hypothetical protein ACRDCN_11055 [Tannerellaceae bacterium]